MGHCDSPAQLGRHGGVLRAGKGAAALDPSSGRIGTADPQNLTAKVTFAARWIFLAFLRIYRIFLSPFFGGACKYHPSCSSYAYEAIDRHGPWRGSMLALKRLGRCRPHTQGGYDPVPERLDMEQNKSRMDLQRPVDPSPIQRPLR